MLTVPPFFEGLVFEVSLGDGRERSNQVNLEPEGAGWIKRPSMLIMLDSLLLHYKHILRGPELRGHVRDTGKSRRNALKFRA